MNVPTLAALALVLAPAFVGAVPRVAAAPATARSDALADLVARTRKATGIEAFARQTQDLLIEGEATIEGQTGRFTLRFAADGRFLSTFDANLSNREGFDGKETWDVDPSGMPAPTTCEAREQTLLVNAILSSRWTLPEAPVIAARIATAAASGPSLVLRARDGVQEITLFLDEASALPQKVLYASQRGEQEWSCSDWKPVGETGAGGLIYPHEFTIDDDGHLNIWRVGNARLVPPAAAATFVRPVKRPADTTFDAAAPTRLAGRRARSGHLLVKAQVDGKDLGWFIFDSGAGSYCISPEAADQLALDSFGETWVGGAGAGRTAVHLREAKEFQIGPVTVHRPVLIELDTKGLSAAFGGVIAGICGYELLMRTVAVVDMHAGTVDLHDPATFARDGVTWRPLTLHGHHPHVHCTFEHDGEEEGLFRLDTGAAGVTVIFHSPVVKSLGLLDGQTTTPFTGLGGVGGQSAVRQGKVDWFELGGLTIDQPVALYSQDERGAMADPWSYGTIGGLLLDRFDLIFDYPHQRIGFAPRKEGKE